MKVDIEHVVDQPVEPVFALMADIGRRPEWVTPAVERTPLSDGPVGVGSRYRAVSSYPGRKATFVQEITAYEPNRLLEEEWDGPMAGKGTTRFVDEQGSTRVIMHMEINPSGFLRFLGPLVSGWATRAIKKDLVRLEEILTAVS